MNTSTKTLVRFSIWLFKSHSCLELFEEKVSLEKLQESLRNKQVILVTDCFELCGILTASTTSESLHKSDGSLSIDLFEVHNDYSKE